MNKKGLDPISLEEYDLNDWLEKDKTNIIIETDDAALCLNESYFFQPEFSDIILTHNVSVETTGFQIDDTSSIRSV